MRARSPSSERATTSETIVGLMPAAGRARRLGAIASSKEVLPVGVEADGSPRPVARHLLDAWARAGIEHALVVLRPEKHDVLKALAEGLARGSAHTIDLAYLAVRDTRSVPETIDRAWGWLRASGASIALGFPDILTTPADAWSRLVAAFRSSPADALLGCFPTDQTWKTDMVDLEPGDDGTDRLRDVVIKQRDCTLRWTWSIALWRPAMIDYLHESLDGAVAGEIQLEATGEELYVGDVLRAAVRDGLDVRGLRFEGGSFLDVGTPEDLERARRRLDPRTDPQTPG